MTKVSVIISSYNHAAFIGQTIESVLNQSFQDFEIIISDDASTDNSDQVIRQYLTDPRVKYYPFRENRVEHMKNNCLKHATGKYIAVLNSDDLFHPKKLAEQFAFLESKESVGAVFTGVQWIDENGNSIKGREAVFTTQNRSRHEWLAHFLVYGNCLCHSSVMIRKDLLDKIGFYNRWLALLSDLDLWIRICLETNIYILPEIYTFNRLMFGEKNASGSRPDILNRFNFESFKIAQNYYTADAITQLPYIFPSVKEFQRTDTDEIKYYFSKYLATLPNVSIRWYAINQFYELYSNANTIKKLAVTLGDSVYADYYNTIAHTSVFPLPHTVAEVFWNKGGKELKKNQIVYSPGIRQELYLSLPDEFEGEHIKLQIYPGNLPIKVHLLELKITSVQGDEVLDLLPSVTYKGDYFLSSKEGANKMILALKGNFAFESTFDSIAFSPQGKMLKITLITHTEFDCYGFDELHQNLEYMSAKRLLSSLVKKLLKRIKSLI